MASLSGFRFDITGASGSQGFLGPKSSWRAYVFPRGGYAAQDSTGTLITFDSADVASRFAVNDWFQAGLLVANIRQVSAVGGDSVAFSGAAMTVSENDRIFLVGTTQPTVTGGSATYTTPNTIVRQRDDDTSTLFTNSQITSNSDGLIQGFAGVNFYDLLIQDGNQANQGSLIDSEVGNVGGVSASIPSIFGATVTFNAAIGVTGSAVFGDTITVVGISGNYTQSGTVIFGQTVTLTGPLGVTGTLVVEGAATFNSTTTMNGALGVTNITTPSGALTITPTTDTLFSDGTGVVIGYTGQVAFGDVTSEMQVIGANETDGSIAIALFSTTDALAPILKFMKSGSAVIGSSASVADDEELGKIQFYGDDGTDYDTLIAEIACNVDDPGPSTGAIAGEIVFSTSQESGTLNVAVTIDSQQRMGILVDPSAQLDVNATNVLSAEPVLRVTQGDIDEPFIDYVGTSAADGSRSISSDTTEDSTKFGAILCEINGVKKWIRVYDNES